MTRPSSAPHFKQLFRQLCKYGIVGIANTAVTFIVYIVLTEALDCDRKTANLVGYVAGVVNSFVWNRQWTFAQTGAWMGSAMRFLVCFLICYLLQRWTFGYLNAHLPILHVYNFILAMIVYNVLFFLAGKYIIFKKYST